MPMLQFRYALLASTLTAALLPALAFSLWQFDDVRDRIAAEDARQVRLADEVSAVVAETIESASRSVLVAAYSASIPLSESPTPALVRTLGETLRRIALSQSVIENLHIDDQHLKSLIFWPSMNEAGDSNLNQSHQDRWHSAALEAKPGTALISPVFQATGAFEGLTVNIAAAIPNAKTAGTEQTESKGATSAAPAVGVVSTALRLGELGRVMTERLAGTDLKAALFDETGRLIFPLEGNAAGEAVALKRALDRSTHHVGLGSDSDNDNGIAGVTLLDIDAVNQSIGGAESGKQAAGASTSEALHRVALTESMLPAGSPHWQVVLYRDAAARNAEMTQLQHRALAWVALVLLLTTFVSVVMSSAMSRAVEKLSRFLSSARAQPAADERIRFPRELADFQRTYIKTKRERDRNESALRALNARLHAEVEERTAELEARRATLEALFDGMAEGVVLFAENRIEAMNREAKQFFPNVSVGDDAELIWTQLGLESRPAVDRVTILKTETGIREVLCFDVRPSAGGALLEGLLIRDVTAREEIAQLKESLLGMAAHELKTPIQTLSLEVEMLGRTEAPEARSAILADLGDSVRHLKTLVHDWLDVARIEGGVFSVVKAPVQLPLIVRRAARMVHARYPFQQVEIVFDEAAECLLGDGDRLLQLFSNLFTNAARYRKLNGKLNGQVENGSHVRVEGTCRNGMIEIAVDDDGIGIALENREKVFERFFQVDASNRRRAGGTGQGLVIARAICRAHGGDIHVEASHRPEGGSRFVVMLPGLPELPGNSQEV